MCRVVYTTTIESDLLRKTKAFAQAQGLGGANDIIERALKLYYQLHHTQIWEKNLPSGKYQTITIHHGGMVLDYVDKRITIDAISDIDHLISDGYHCTFEL